MQRGGHQRVLRHGVATLGEHDRSARGHAPVDLRVVAALGRLHLEAEGPQRGHVRLDGAGAEVAAAGVRQLEVGAAVEQRAEEHDDRAGTPRGLLVDVGEVELGRGDDLEVVVVVEPPGLDAEAVEDLQQPVDLLDPGDLAQRGAAAIEQRGAQQRDAGVLGGLHLDRPGQRRGAGDAQVGRAGTERDDLGVEGRADPRQHLQGEVLVSLLDPVDGRLTGGQPLGQLLLGQPAVLAGVADEVADPALVVLAHADHVISGMR